MLMFALRRLAYAIVVMLVVGLVAFSLFQFVGDPIVGLVGQDTGDKEREELREQLGLNDPIPVQFARFAYRAAQADFGISYRQQRPVMDLFVKRIPATLELSFMSALFALFVGIPLGVHAGLHRRNWTAKVSQSTALVGISLPPFLVGILLIYLFAVTLEVLPSSGRGEVVDLGLWSTGLLTASGLKSLILPTITLGLFQMTLIMRLVRAEMLEVLRSDYIKFARARGLPDRAVHFHHALKNSLVPVITITGMQLGSIIAFAIITETVFQWPGMGYLFIQAVAAVDIPVMAAYLVLVALLFVLINLVVDVLYYAIDPRLRVQSSGGSDAHG
jgi:peptide/nickel transport system permease protein